ncbi:thioesterase II family protein [[Flexibacter] sp. ATCC 35208]|uniref:thioesterase II family protein n=1 Tax=[Flexibacter] sp. ATCC 35208 TaxID=1936242 RepID=UPI0009CA8BF4|nr:thioesterase domain-containing protein [[Flexibacter] sp. ATCC 35208]OMP77909.1 hypothetical protein BW716_17695 [[Flexibacter] sp. ATCC 35208]
MKPQLFMIHFAGGNMYSFSALAGALRPFFTVELLELPGRGKRIEEALLFTRKEAVADLLRQISARRNGAPYYIYGHSMGADLGFRVCRELEMIGDRPACFIPSGNPGPNITKRERLAHLPREAFFKELQEMGGINAGMLEDEELAAFIEPILRADFEMLEKEDPVMYKIDTPIYAFMGDKEKYVTDIANWAIYTRSNFSFRVLEGNHFFIFNHSAVIANTISYGMNQVSHLYKMM